VENAVSRAALQTESDRLVESARSRDLTRFREASTTLYARLIAPVAEGLDPAAPIVFVPDDTLESVPFSALLAPDGTYVVEHHVVVVSPSAAAFSQLAARRRDDHHRMRLLLISGAAAIEGDTQQLTYAGREAKAVSDAYDPSSVVVANDTTPAALDREAAVADVIHFVGHAEPPQVGANGALIAAGRPDQVERLDTHRIAALPLHASRVVVLAACATAHRTPRPGAASMSVARAFLAAGTPSVVATLWPIDDGPAADFFPSLHRRLAGGTPPAEALRATQLEWIHRLDAPPAMWAAVQIIGS
jgi:CHAT domain-containing protein